jgi:hypothetical protein
MSNPSIGNGAVALIGRNRPRRWVSILPVRSLHRPG